MLKSSTKRSSKKQKVNPNFSPKVNSPINGVTNLISDHSRPTRRSDSIVQFGAQPVISKPCISKWQAFKLATLSGLAEPLGVIIVAYLFPSSLDPQILEGLLGAVGGVMAFLTLHEMLPLAFDYAGQKQAVKAVFIGMAFMSARTAIKRNMDVQNYGYAKQMLELLLSKAPPSKQEELRSLIDICVQRGLTNKSIDPLEDPSQFCAATLSRLSTIGYDVCDLCGAKFSALASPGCIICGMGSIKRSDALAGPAPVPSPFG